MTVVFYDNSATWTSNRGIHYQMPALKSARVLTICSRHIRGSALFAALLLFLFAFAFVPQTPQTETSASPREQIESKALESRGLLESTGYVSDHITKAERSKEKYVGTNMTKTSALLKEQLQDGEINTYAKARKQLKDYKYQDIMKMKPIRYLDNFKNPCWLGTKNNGPINDNKVHCLPYFYVIGVKKCGTSDLFDKIKHHPDVASDSSKEQQWFPQIRFKIEPFLSRKGMIKDVDPRKLQYYVRMFDSVTKSIQAAKKGTGSTAVSNMVTGEGTPANLHLQGVWDLLPGNKGLSEPRYTNMHYIKHLIPQAKLIVVFRNPTDRLYSDFLMHHGPGAENFHKNVTSMVETYTNCFKEHAFRQCIYNHSFTDVSPMTFAPAVGFYAFFMKEIWNVFPANQVLPILFDEYSDHPRDTMINVFEFLGLRSLGKDQITKMLLGPVHNSGQGRHTTSGPMLDKTRAMLDEFYRASNEDMAKLMGDSRYLFSEQ